MIPEGKISLLHRIGKLIIFLYVFKQQTPCSEAVDQDFDEASVDITDLMKIQWNDLKVDKNMAWSFFSLNDDIDYDVNKDFNGASVRSDYEYRIPVAESQRSLPLLLTVKQYVRNHSIPAHVEMVDPTLAYNKGCQFSGGGDIRISTDALSCVIIHDKTEADGGSSPIYDGSTVQSLSVEAKKGDYDLKKLRNQLFANMMVASVSNFIDTLKNYTEKDILGVKQLTGYGIPYTGAGIVGFYKLRIEFGQPTQFITKIFMTQRPQGSAAMLVDYLLENYFMKLNKVARISM